MEGGLSAVVPPHGTRIYKLEADTRLERYIYEAETAFLHDYQEIYNNQAVGSAVYDKNSAASGGAFVGWLGGKRSNSLLWKDVYVIEEADYTVHFCATSGETRPFNVVLNGEEKGTISVMTNGWSTFKEYNMTLHLQAGSNSIELYNENGWMPNVDYMSLEKVGENTVLTRQLEEVMLQLEVMSRNPMLTNRLQQDIARLQEKAAGSLTTTQLKSLITEIKTLQNTIGQVVPVCEEYQFWRAYAEKNVEASMESTVLTSFISKITKADTSLSKANTLALANSALSSLKSAITTYLKSVSAVPKEGEYLDMTMFVSNHDFSTEEGWQGNPTYRDGCGEEFNKSFDLYQTLSNMRPGVYTVKCNAFFRPKGNDGGSAYRAGTENILAYLYVNDEMVKLKSLYSETWPEASQYGSVDNQNGYPHSMRAAGIRFAEGCYQNEIRYTQSEKGTLRFGLKSDNGGNSSWCCFDNFALYYQPFPDFYDGINAPSESPVNMGDIYDLQGRKLANGKRAKGIFIRNGKKIMNNE